MATVSRFFGIKIKIWWDDHPPPHFHAVYQGFEAVFDIKSSQKIEGVLPPRIDRIVRKWAGQHREELLECWELITKKEPFYQIEGADKL